MQTKILQPWPIPPHRRRRAAITVISSLRKAGCTIKLDGDGKLYLRKPPDVRIAEDAKQVLHDLRSEITEQLKSEKRRESSLLAKGRLSYTTVKERKQAE